MEGIRVEVALRPVQAGDCAEVVNLHRSVFTADQVARTIFVAPRVDRYLASLVVFPQFQRDHALWGAWAGEQLVGYSYFRALPTTWHSNYLAVKPEYQGQGIGQMLRARVIEIGRRLGYDQISMDIHRQNLRGLNWWRQHGFQIVHTCWIYEKDLGEHTAHEHPAIAQVRLLDWEQSEAWQAAYGFSKFRLVHEENVYEVGRLGNRHFRAAKPLPEIVEAVLAQIDSTRRLLIRSATPPLNKVLKLEISHRLQGHADWLEREGLASQRDDPNVDAESGKEPGVWT